jgi:replication initiation and membrane attachment protein DnaB
MHDDTKLLEAKERKLARYLEAYSTEEVLKEVQEYIPSLSTHPDILRKLSEMKLPPPVINTLIYYALATNKQKFGTYKLLALADLCIKFNIRNAQVAITFFKQYYSYHTQISQEG